jgi:collagenase-like PrtC family protease
MDANNADRMALTAGPLLYYWPRETILHFYADLAESVVDTIVLGEVVCSRRHEMKSADWLDLARDLKAEGKEVVLATQSLVESDADLRTLRRIAEQRDFLVEAGDVSALNVLADTGSPFVLGPHINVYSRPALEEYVRLGALRWVPPIELSLAAIGDTHRDGPLLPTEVFAHGRMPLAFSARCFTARHHQLGKDQCEFRCRDDPDGLLLSTTDGEPFLVLNGIQTQSAKQQCLIAERAAMVSAGVTRLRLSPSSVAFGAVVDAYDSVMNRGATAEAAIAVLDAASPRGGLADGYARGRPGLEWSHA